ncbi:MAG TPA: hypothetical protein PKH02_07995, partial [Bacteroidales bacterium]|nr:hypothetical protein [Bacteroidales bacterium]
MSFLQYFDARRASKTTSLDFLFEVRKAWKSSGIAWFYCYSETGNYSGCAVVILRKGGLLNEKPGIAPRCHGLFAFYPSREQAPMYKSESENYSGCAIVILRMGGFSTKSPASLRAATGFL